MRYTITAKFDSINCDVLQETDNILCILDDHNIHSEMDSSCFVSEISPELLVILKLALPSNVHITPVSNT